MTSRKNVRCYPPLRRDGEKLLSVPQHLCSFTLISPYTSSVSAKRECWLLFRPFVAPLHRRDEACTPSTNNADIRAGFSVFKNNVFFLIVRLVLSNRKSKPRVERVVCTSPRRVYYWHASQEAMNSQSHFFYRPPLKRPVLRPRILTTCERVHRFFQTYLVRCNIFLQLIAIAFFALLYRRNTLYTRNVCSHTCTLNLHTCLIS